MNNLTLIAAIGKNNELGKNNTLIWNLKGDLKFFKENTEGKPIIMGKKTKDSLPKLLPNRTHIVLTTQNIEIPGVIVVHSKEQLYSLIKEYKKEIMVIGGASIYKLLMNDANKMLLTEINAADKNADTYFPNFNKEEWMKRIIKNNYENGIEYRHVEYKRKIRRV